MKICASCKVELRCLKNGHLLVTSTGMFSSDRYGCPECGAEVILGVGREPVVSFTDPDYLFRLTSERSRVGVENVTETEL